jgi:PIF1-like helicase
VDKFPGSQFKGFNSQAEAMSYIAGITLMKKQLKEMETPQQRSIPSDSLPSPKPWHKYEAEEERRYQALGSRSMKKSTARMQSLTTHDDYDFQIVDVVDVEPLGGDGSSPSQGYVIDDRPTQVAVNTAKRPSPVYPEVNRKKARTTAKEIIDLTVSPPKGRSSYNALDVDEFPHSPESLESPTSFEELSFVLQDRGYPPRDTSRQDFDIVSDCDSEVRFKSTFVPSPTSSEELSFVLQKKNHSRSLPPQNGQAKPNGLKGKSDPTSTRANTLTSSVPFVNADCSPQQQRILDLVAADKNVFFTGSAGVGKSFVLNKICEKLKSQGLKQFTDFFMTASTGIAAVQIGGMTVHSFAGVGKGEDGVIQLKKQCARNKRVKKHWKNCKVLIIDEVSMVCHFQS